jgi:hypothetical protein
MMKIKIIKKRSKKKNLRKNLMLAGLSVALLSQPVMAETKKWTFHEGKWKDVKAYGKTTISEDSAREWGPWTEFVQPAAGPIPLVALPQISTDGPSYFRPESADEYSPKYTQVAPVEGLCQSGWCGYAALIGGVYHPEGDSIWIEHQPFDIALEHQAPSDGWDEDGAVNFIVLAGSGLPEGQPPAETGFIPSSFYGAPGTFDGSIETSNAYLYINGGDGAEGYLGYDPNIVTIGEVSGYVWGDGGEAGFGGGAYVAGVLTPLMDIAALQAGNLTAYYTGYTAGTHWEHDNYPESPVAITVNFGNSTWSGSWNNGVDGYTHTHSADSTGQVHVFGQVGFNASGNISGANIQSTSVSTADPGATVSGSVQGSFFGPNAGALGGIVDITKSNPAGGGEYGYGYTDAQYVDVFVTTKEGD